MHHDDTTVRAFLQLIAPLSELRTGTINLFAFYAIASRGTDKPHYNLRYWLTIAQSSAIVLFGLRQPAESLLITFTLAAVRSLRATAACLRVLRLFTATMTRINCESGNLDSSLWALTMCSCRWKTERTCSVSVLRNTKLDTVGLFAGSGKKRVAGTAFVATT